MREFKLVRSERGAAAVEFAIIVPVLLLIVFGVIEFGYAFYVRNNVVAAMREGARIAASGMDRTAVDPSTGDAAARVVDYIHGTLGTNQNPAITTASVSVVKDATTGLITVKLTNGYPYTTLTPFAGRFGLTGITFRDSATFRWEQQQ